MMYHRAPNIFNTLQKTTQYKLVDCYEDFVKISARAGKPTHLYDVKIKNNHQLAITKSCRCRQI
jgi:hypothetical protein